MRLLLLLVLGCSLARADSLTDLRATLGQITGRAPVRATVSFELARGSGEEEKATRQTKVNAVVEDTADGLHIKWPREIVDAAVTEEAARAKDRNAPAWTRRTMDGLNATVLNDYLNASGLLLRVLASAELISETQDAWQGQPARLLTLKVNPPLSDKDKKYIKEVSVVGKIWLGADGWPLAAEQVLDVKGRALLVITFAQHEKQEFHFARAGDRLVTIYHLKESEHSGGGERGTDQSLATLLPEKA